MSLIEVNNLKKHYHIKKSFGHQSTVKALDGVSFSVEKNKTLGIVGESGCGKSTLAKVLMGLEHSTEGEILFSGKNLIEIPKNGRFSFIQMIFQDPYSSLNPRKKAWQIVTEPLAINSNKSKDELYEIAKEMMNKVGLRPYLADRYPHMFSGGQRQRLGLARSLVLHPQVLICDEPVSALDVSIQAQVLNLLMDLQDEMGLTYLFISHDLSVVNHISDHILVMYLGKIVEYGPRELIFNDPKHPYTKALMASSPSVDRAASISAAVKGELPSPLNPPTGCAFHKRCPIAKPECSINTQNLKEKYERFVACDQI